MLTTKINLKLEKKEHESDKKNMNIASYFYRRKRILTIAPPAMDKYNYWLQKR